MISTIGFDARSLCGDRTGVGTYAGNLIWAMLDADPQIHPVLFSDDRLPPLPWLRDERIRTVVRGTANQNNLVWTNVYLRKAAAKEQLSLFHSPGYTRPLGLRVPSMVTLHDVCYEAAPQWYPYKLGFARRLWYRLSAEGADAIITVSEFSRREILRTYRVAPEKVHTIYEGVDRGKFRPLDDPKAVSNLRNRYNLEEEFALVVGDIHPRRNVGRIIEALRQLKSLNLQLVSIGRSIDLPNAWKQPNVRYLGYVPDDDLPVFYNAARVLVYPSLYEGFGFPIVEAMASGCPVIVSKGTACEETAGGAGITVDPVSVHAIAEAIEGLLLNPELSARCRTAGLKRSAEFDWRKTAKQTLELYSRL